MAEKENIITLVATERCFRGGRLVERGHEFQFNTIGDDGKARKLPKHAMKKDDPALAKELGKKAITAGDLRPKDAQAASKTKREGLADDLAG